MTSPDVLFLFDGDNTLSGSIRPGVTSWGKANCEFRQPNALARGRRARRPTCKFSKPPQRDSRKQSAGIPWCSSDTVKARAAL
jgi:hypothetical protein